MTENLDWLDFFHGGVPPYQFFRLSFDELSELVASSKVEDGLDTTAEVCLIGLAACFEAFCKNQFAAIMNICPETLAAFAEKRQEASLSLGLLASFMKNIDFRIGSLISEQYDFGPAKTINGLFQDLLKVTPFSNDEMAEYSNFLNDRNLLVHHGGVFTHKYRGQQYQKKEIQLSRVYFDSLVVGKNDFSKWANWANGMAKKIVEASHSGLESFIVTAGLTLEPERKKAADGLLSLD
jgi:hypothetical protein